VGGAAGAALKITLRHGDCVAVMRTLADGSVGAVVCDPPYGIGFMDKDFDHIGTGADQQAWHADWLRECFRVLVPGGRILAFGGSRVYHRMAAAFDDAGFIDVGVEAWGYGSGFPKPTHNIAIVIDKQAGAMAHRFKAFVVAGRDGNDLPGPSKDIPPYTPITDAAKAWNGWGTNLKPSWEPFIVGRKPE
jgi:SAM-dependent methyltransferase